MGQNIILCTIILCDFDSWVIHLEIIGQLPGNSPRQIIVFNKYFYTGEFTKQLAFYKILLLLAASRHFVSLFLLLYSAVAEYKECHIEFYLSQHQISYIHLCNNTTHSVVTMAKKWCFIIHRCQGSIKTSVLRNILGALFL